MYYLEYLSNKFQLVRHHAYGNRVLYFVFFLCPCVLFCAEFLILCCQNVIVYSLIKVSILFEAFYFSFRRSMCCIANMLYKYLCCLVRVF